MCLSYLDDNCHEYVGEGCEDAGSVQRILENISHKHWQAGQKGVEPPVFSEVGNNVGPDWFACKHCLPWRGASNLTICHPDGILEVLELLVCDGPILIRGVLNNPPPHQAP